MQVQEARYAIDEWCARLLSCEPQLLAEPSKQPRVLERRRDAPPCPDGRPMPFYAVDNNIAQVISVCSEMRSALEETVYNCTHWSERKIDLHDVIFFEEEFWPKVGSIAPLERWSKTVYTFCTLEDYRPSRTSHNVVRATPEMIEKYPEWFSKAEEQIYYCVLAKAEVRDFNGRLQKIDGPVSVASFLPVTEKVAVLAVGTRYEFRGEGMARTTVMACVEHLLKTGRISLYAAESENFASLALPRSLGFREYGKVLAFLGELVKTD